MNYEYIFMTQLGWLYAFKSCRTCKTAEFWLLPSNVSLSIDLHGFDVHSYKLATLVPSVFTGQGGNNWLGNCSPSKLFCPPWHPVN